MYVYAIFPEAKDVHFILLNVVNILYSGKLRSFCSAVCSASDMAACVKRRAFYIYTVCEWMCMCCAVFWLPFFCASQAHCAQVASCKQAAEHSTRAKSHSFRSAWLRFFARSQPKGQAKSKSQRQTQQETKPRQYHRASLRRAINFKSCTKSRL